MKPAAINITIYQGTTHYQEFQWKVGSPAVAVDLTGYTARMQIRPKIVDPTVICSLTTENGGIVISDPVNGKFSINISATDTAAFEFKNAVYDIELVIGSNVRRLFGGTVTLSPEVTR